MHEDLNSDPGTHIKSCACLSPQCRGKGNEVGLARCWPSSRFNERTVSKDKVECTRTGCLASTLGSEHAHKYTCAYPHSHTKKEEEEEEEEQRAFAC